MSSARFGDSQLRQAGKGLLLPLLQPLHALRIFQLPGGATPFQQLADGIGQLSLTESRKIGDDLAHQIQFAGGEHAPAERNGLFQMFRSPTAAADAATSRVGHPEEKVQRNLTRLLYGKNGKPPGAGKPPSPTTPSRVPLIGGAGAFACQRPLASTFFTASRHFALASPPAPRETIFPMTITAITSAASIA